MLEERGCRYVMIHRSKVMNKIFTVLNLGLSNLFKVFLLL